VKHIKDLAIDLLTLGKDQALSALTLCIAFFAPVHRVVFFTAVLVIVDMITGIRAACARGEQIRSHKIARSITKLFHYLVVICVAFIVQREFLLSAWLVQIVSGVVAAAELKSVLENLEEADGSDVWSKLWKRLAPQWEKREEEVRRTLNEPPRRKKAKFKAKTKS